MGISELKPIAESLQASGQQLVVKGSLQQMRDGPALILVMADLMVKMAERIDALTAFAGEG